MFQSLFSNKVADGTFNFIKKVTLAQVFFNEFRKILWRPSILKNICDRILLQLTCLIAAFLIVGWLSITNYRSFKMTNLRYVTLHQNANQNACDQIKMQFKIQSNTNSLRWLNFIE